MQFLNNFFPYKQGKKLFQLDIPVPSKLPESKLLPGEVDPLYDLPIVTFDPARKPCMCYSNLKVSYDSTAY